MNNLSGENGNHRKTIFYSCAELLNVIISGKTISDHDKQMIILT
jgi:hypothetical protein